MKSKSWKFILFFVLVLLICTPVFGNVARAKEEFDAVVVATGDDTANCERPDLPGVFVTQDVCNVQAAVDANPGGRILLQGTFHFAEYGDDGYVVPGTDGTVFITNDVEIMGEKQGIKSLTKIEGGYYTFSIGHLPRSWTYHLSDEVFDSPSNAVPVSVTIQDIDFENTFFMTIRIWATTGATIKGNRIIDTRLHSMEDFFGPGSHGSSFGIALAPPGVFLFSNPQFISGKIEIKDNYIDGMYRRAESDDPWGAPSFDILTRGIVQGGIWVSQYDADIDIKDNTVFNTGFIGILAGGNTGETQIKNNFIQLTAPDGDILQSIYGIETHGYYFYGGYETARYIIAENEIAVGGNCPGIWAIYVDANLNSPKVSKNDILLLPGAELGIFLGNVSNADISENEISGDGQYGIVLGHWEWPLWLGNNSNTVRDNDLTSFNPSVADYYLGDGATNNLLYVGDNDAVLDDSGNDTNIIYR